ncbi:MAG: hypothetical protein GX257_11345 [Clostridiales bacterium]|nr:hypothetical protein [Clostridiales bacterium]
MDKINIATVSGVASSATAVPVVIPEFQKAKALIRRFSALGNDAACAVKFYVPKLARSFQLLEALDATATKVKIPVDVAGGHKFKGHTLTQADKLLLLTPTGWKVVGAQYANVAGKPYCEATITAVGAIPAKTRAYILVPSHDVVDGLPAIGNAAVTVEDFISGDAGAPLLFDLVAAENKSVTAAAFVEYWF